MPKVSVILPVYNVAPYLEEALDSLMNQTLKEIELIVVNDGSTDESEAVIRKYQQQDNRIKLYSQANQGQAAARNLALQYARGEFIYMMDADDVLNDSEVLQMCYDYAKKVQADFVFFDREGFSDGPLDMSGWVHSTEFVEENQKYDGEKLLDYQLDTASYNSVVWLLFIKHEHLKHLGLKFYPGIIHEDELFTTQLMLSSNAVYCYKHSLVRHRVHSTSTIGKGYTRHNIDCYLTVADELLKFSQAPIIHKYLCYTLSKVFYTGHQIPYRDKPAVVWRMLKSGYLKYVGIKSLIKFLTL